jgi:3-deoxy-D-manno-octulosonic-acid transferase
VSSSWLWRAYGAFGTVYENLWKRGLIKPSGNRWHEQRSGLHAARDDRPLWLHAASLGEVRVAGAYLKDLSSLAPLYLTLQTDSGFRAAVASFGSDRVGYAPLDRAANVRRFVTSIQPRGLVIFETELWPHWLAEFQGPVWFANARLSTRTVARLSPLRRVLEPLWHNVRRVFAQTALDAHRFTCLGLPAARTCVAGQVKQFELPLESGAELRSRWRRRLGIGEKDLLYVAGSIRHDELSDVLSQFKRCASEERPLHLVLAPRHLKYVGLAERKAWDLGLRTRRVSSLGGPSQGALVFILDTHGDLAQIYAAADVAILGGTFAPHGGHNPNEPAAFGVPVITGPYTELVDGDLALLSSVSLAYRLENPHDLPAVAAGLARFNRARARHELQDRIAQSPHPARLLAESVRAEWAG